MSRGSSLFDDVGDSPMVASASNTPIASEGLFSETDATARSSSQADLTSLVGSAGLFGDEVATAAPGTAVAPAHVVVTPPKASLILSQREPSTSGVAVESMDELRSMLADTSSLFEAMQAGGDGSRHPEAPSKAAATAMPVTQGDVSSRTNAAGQSPPATPPSAPAPAPPATPGTWKDRRIAQSGGGSVFSPGGVSKAGANRGAPAVGDEDDVYRQASGSTVHPLNFSGSLATTSKPDLIALIEQLRARVTELEADLKETKQALSASKEDVAHLRMENSKLRIRYHTRPSSEYDFSGLSSPAPGVPPRHGSAPPPPDQSPVVVRDNSHPLATSAGGMPVAGRGSGHHSSGSGSMFLPASWEGSGGSGSGSGGGSGSGSGGNSANSSSDARGSGSQRSTPVADEVNKQAGSSSGGTGEALRGTGAGAGAGAGAGGGRGAPNDSSGSAGRATGGGGATEEVLGDARGSGGRGGLFPPASPLTRPGASTVAALDPTWGSAAPSYLKSKDSNVGRRVVASGTPRRAADFKGLFGDDNDSEGSNTLFEGIAEVNASRPHRSASAAASSAEADIALFKAFMATPDAMQLKKAVSQFMKRTHAAIESGALAADIGTSVGEFMEGAVNWLYERDLFKSASDATVDYARDELEKEIMRALHPLVFKSTPEEKAEDDALFQRCAQLQFLSAENLDVPAGCNNEMVIRLAQDELSRVNSYVTPQDKLDCIVACCDILFRSLNLTRGADASRPGADEFLPVFIFVVLRANVRQVLANARYIDRFRYPGGLMSKSGYCFANFQSALAFLKRLDHTSVQGISKEEFDGRFNGTDSATADVASDSAPPGQ